MRKQILLLPLLLLVCTLAWAQDMVRITGKVYSAEDKSPLPGVTVVAKGTSTGTSTDVNGAFTLNVPVKATLVFSFVGMITQEIALSENQTELEVALASDSKQLTEVVVTAQGIVREKRALGYAVSTVGKDAVAERPQADLGRALQGKIAGVNITQTSGVSGTGTNITIRGYSSISGSVQPLFVVDGVPFNSNTNSNSNSGASFVNGGQTASSRFLDLDPNNIESISVLKGLAAAVLYGDQGRNGVILVTTKNGGKGKSAEITLTQSVFANNVVLPEFQNTYAGGFQQNPGFFFSNWGPRFDEVTTTQPHPYSLLTNASLRAAMSDYVSKNPYTFKAYENNVKDFFRTGLVSNTSLNVSGGTSALSYNASVGYNKEQGYIENNDLSRLTLGLGIRAQLSKKISLNSSFNFTNTETNSPPLNAGQGNNTLNGFPSVLANVMYTPRSVDLMGFPYESPVDNRSVYFRSGNDIPNPRWIVKYYSTPSTVNRLFTSNSLNIDFTDNLSLVYRVGLDTYNEKQEARFNKNGIDFPNGFYGIRDITNTIWDHSAILSYNKEINADLTVSGKIGANMRNDFYQEMGTQGQNQLTFGLMRLNNFIDYSSYNYSTEQTRIGIYGELTGSYKNFLFLNLAGRNDWTSTVEIGNRRIFYPSGSLSFVPTSAIAALQNNNIINFLKLRTGIGTSAGFPNPYNTRNTLGQSSRAFLSSAGTVFQTHTVNNFLGNPNLKPELHTEYEAGVEGKFLNNKISLDFTWYRRETRDLVTTAPLDPSTGYTQTTINIGKISNTGFEVVVGATPVSTPNFTWETTLNYSRNVPKVEELSSTLKEVVVAGFSNLGNFAVPGEPFNIIKGTAYQRNAEGKLIVGADGYYIADPNIRTLGNPNPQFNSSWINSFTYKGITLSLMLEYRHGGVIYSTTAGALLGRGVTKDSEFNRANTFILPGVKQDGQPNDIQITASEVYFSNIYFFGDEGRIFDASTLRIREASLSYALPKNLVQKTPFKSISLSLTGNNLWFKALYFPQYLNFDTDNLGLGVGNGMGFEFLTGPPSRRFGGTLRLTF